MKKEYGNILDRWFEEVWNDGRAEAIDELAAPDIVSHGLDHFYRHVPGASQRRSVHRGLEQL